MKIAIVDYLDHWKLTENGQVSGNERGLNDAINFWIQTLQRGLTDICTEKHLKLILFFTEFPQVAVDEYFIDVNYINKKIKRVTKKQFSCFVESKNKKIRFDKIETKFQGINCCSMFENERVFLEKHVFCN